MTIEARFAGIMLPDYFPGSSWPVLSAPVGNDSVWQDVSYALLSELQSGNVAPEPQQDGEAWYDAAEVAVLDHVMPEDFAAHLPEPAATSESYYYVILVGTP